MWGFGTIVNGLGELLHCEYAVPPGETTTGDAFNTTLGRATLTFGTLGAIYLTDLGAQPGGPYPNCVEVQWGSTVAQWFYPDPTGFLDVQANADGTFALSGYGQELDGDLTGQPTLAGRR